MCWGTMEEAGSYQTPVGNRKGPVKQGVSILSSGYSLAVESLIFSKFRHVRNPDELQHCRNSFFEEKNLPLKWRKLAKNLMSIFFLI